MPVTIPATLDVLNGKKDHQMDNETEFDTLKVNISSEDEPSIQRIIINICAEKSNLRDPGCVPPGERLPLFECPVPTAQDIAVGLNAEFPWLGITGAELLRYGTIQRLTEAVSNKKQMVDDASQHCGIPSAIIEDVYRMTPMQEGLWTASIQHPGAYSYRLAIEVKAECTERLLGAWNHTVQYTPMLRTIVATLGSGGQEPSLVVIRNEALANLPGPLMGLLPKLRLGRTNSQATPASRDQSSPQRTRITKLTLDIHHVLFDGWSMHLILERLRKAYLQDTLPSLPHFRDFVQYLRESEHDGEALAVTENSDDFWRLQLTGSTPVGFPVPAASRLAHHEPITDATLTKEHRIDLPSNGIFEGEVSLSVVLQTAWAILIGTYEGVDDVVFASVMSGREAPVSGLLNMVGPTMAIVPCRVHLDRHIKIRDLITSVAQYGAAIMPHQHVGLARIRKACSSITDLSLRNLLVVQSPEFQAVGFTSGTDERWECLRLNAHYDTHIFSNQAQVARLMDHFAHIIGQVCHGLHQSHMEVGDLTLVSQQDILWIQKQMKSNIGIPLQERQGYGHINSASLDTDKCIHDLIQVQTQRRPNKLAVDAWDRKLTYAQLDQLSSLLAAALSGAGVGPDKPVLVCFGRSVWVVVAILAVLKAGGVFVPLDVLHPDNRLRDIARIVQPVAAITAAHLRDRIATLVDSHTPIIVPQDILEQAVPTYLSPGVGRKPVPSNLAYIIFTSGTTGEPKGVAVEHRAVCSSCITRMSPNSMNMDRDSRVLQFSSHNFDAFIDEVFMTLLSGACICIPTLDQLRDDLAGTITRYQVTWAFLTPSVARTLDPAHTKTLKTLTLGGEAVLTTDVEQWYAQVPQLCNGYGPTECCVICVVHPRMLPHRNDSEIGWPQGCLAFVADPESCNRLMPLGAVGELLIAGPNLARGYYGDASGTATSWVSDLHWPLDLPSGYQRVYRTGDLVRVLPESDGILVYVGRKDDGQAKLRGQRFELAEVETHVLRAMPEIRQAAAVLFKPLRSDDVTPTKNKRISLALAFVPAADEDLTRINNSTHELSGSLQSRLCDVRRQLEADLPSYMVPSVWIPLREIPLTSSSKVDRRIIASTLEGMSRTHMKLFKLADSSHERKQPTTEVEKQLALAWASVLGLDPSEVGADDDFFALGGDSILATRIVASCRSPGLPTLSTAAILRHRTIASLAKLPLNGTTQGNALEDTKSSLLFTTPNPRMVQEAAKACETDAALVDNVYPATPMQKALFTIGSRDKRAYRGIFVYTLVPTVDQGKLCAAWNMLAAATPILRTRLILIAADIWQAVLRTESTQIRVESGSLEEYLARERDATMAMSFGAALFRATFLVDRKSRYLIFGSHHAVYDGWSLRTLMRELENAYIHNNMARPSYVISNNHLHFVRYVAQVDPKESRKFWSDYLAERPNVMFPQLKAALASRQPSTDTTVRQDIILPASSYSTSTLLYAAWAQLAAIHTNTADVLFGITNLGRDLPDFQHSWDIVGPLITTTPLRVKISPDVTTSDYLEAVSDAVQTTTPYQHFGLQSIRQASRDSGVACEFNSLLIVQYPEESDCLVVEKMDIGGDVHPYPLVLEATPLPKEGIIRINAHFDSVLLEKEMIISLIASLGHLLATLSHPKHASLKLEAIDMLPAADRSLIYTWNADSNLPSSVDLRIHDVIHDHAIRNPTDDAIVAWDGIFTYKELDHLSKCLADILLEAGVRRTELVPICLERSAWWAVAQLGVLKAGAACISLDPNYPAARNRKILTTSLAKVIIVSNDTRNLFEGSGLKLITLDEPSLKMRPEPFTWINAREEVISSDPAYVVFTSGSTGSPKGIAIEHVALCTSAVNYGKALSISQSSRVLQFASCTFDVSVGEVLTTLMHGGCVCIPSDEERLSELPNCVNRYQVNWLYLTSSIALLMKPRDLPSLKTLVVGGEAVHQSVIETWAESHVDLINAYGPAEASIYCAMRTVTSRTIDARDIGKAVGCRMWITQIDNPHRLVPIGVTGEILIEGPILAREYLYNPELTAEHFITTSWLPGRRLYRTGDLACYDFDGNMNFRGRLDSQGKIRGQRLDSRELETHLLGVRDVVREAAAVVVDWRHQQTEATAKLVAFVAFQDIPVEDTARRHVLRMTTISRSRFRSLKAHLEGLVPKHMLPSMYVPMRQLPKTTSLKLDRAALAALVSEFRQEELQEYSLRDTQEETNVVNGTKISHSAEEKVLLCLWSRLLSLDEGEIGKNESFFNMGGDSASAMQFVWEAKEQGWNLSLSDLYQKPTITLLARHIATRNAKSTLPQIPARFALLGDDEKEEIFDLLRTSRTIPTSEIEDIYPATDTQIALLSQTADRPGIWVAKDRWAFPVGFDVDRFRAALETLVDKTPILRTRIVQSSSGSRCYQVVLHHKSITSMWEDSTQAKDIGFNTSLSVYRILSPNDTQGLPELEWVRHHAIYDGWSTKLMFNFVSQYYRNGVILPSLQPYSCYVKLIQCLDKENARSTWKSVLRDIGEDALRGASFPLSLQHSSREQDQSSAEDSPVAASKLQRKLSITISPERGSLSAVLEAAWSLVLSAYADSQDIIFGVIQSGRTGASMEDVVGPTISFTPRRFKMNDSMSIGTFLENSYTDSASVVQYQHLGLGIIKDAFPHQSIRFENVLVMQGNGFGEKDSERHMQEMGLQQIFKDNQGDGEPFALVLECTPGKATCQGVLQIAARYDKRIIEHKTIERLLSYWESIANQLFTLPLQTRLSDVPLWNEGTLGNKQILPKPVETRIQDLVSRHWEYGSGHAAAPAIETTSGLAFTYREVRQQAARQCAELLRNGFDAQNGSFVLICSERSPWTVIAMFAVWLAGGAVVLLDPSLPLNRLHSIAQKVKANVVLSSTPAKRIWEQYPNSLTIIDIIPPSTGGDYEAKLATPPAVTRNAGDICYCVFTSGSTGEPKGILVTHGAISTSAVYHGQRTGLNKDSRVLQFASYSFDVAIDEMVTTLVHGGCVCIPSEDDRNSRLAEAINEMRVNTTLLTPGVLQTLNPESVSCLNTVVVGGSQLSDRLRSEWQHRVRLLVAYGPSECAITATMRVDDSDTGNIGRPVGCRAWVVTKGGRPAPPGCIGELVLGGPILAQGYLNDEKLTAEHFILAADISPNFCTLTGCAPATRLYKTGDVAKENLDGTLTWIGRQDNQIKVRGVRVELEEVERCIGRCDALSINSVVTLPAKGPLACRLVGVLEPQTGDQNSTTTAIHLEDETKVGIIKAHLKRYLPTTHIPVAWVAIGRFPLMPSGKVDRAWIQRQLEDMQHDSRPTPDATALSVVTVLENKVLDVIEQVLGNDAARKQSGSTFLELGGDSLMAMNIVARCRASNIHITLGLLLGGQSVRELVKSATQKSRETVSISRDAYEPNVKNLPLTLMQMKFFDFYPFGPNHFNQSMFVSIASPRTANVCCRKILHSLVKHHPALRTRFERREGNQKWFPQPIDQIANALSFREHSVDSETSPIIEREMVASHKSLNINTGPLFSARAFSIKNTGLRYLYLVAHHTIVDIVSWTILLNDIESLLGGQELPLDPITYVSEPPFENEDRHAVRPLHDKSATSRINDFWGVVDGPRTTATGTRRFNMRLEPEKTRILIDSVRKIEGLQVADVLEGAIACAFMRICEREGRHADLEMFIEEHGRHSSDGVANLAVGWFTKLRKVALPESPSSTPLVEMIWYAHDQRVRFREVNHANSFQLPIEFVFNYTGKARALTDDGLFRQVSPSTAALAKKVPDVDPHLTPMSLIELLVAHSDDSLNLQIQHDVRIQRTSLLHEFLGTFLVLLKDEIIPGLTSKDWQTRLRRLAVLDSGDYTTSQRLREELLSKLELEDLDAVEDVWMCTPWQNRIIFAQLQDPKLYHIHAAWKVSSPNILDAEKVDEEKLRAACDTVVQHHPALRVAFVQLTGMTSLTQVLLRHTGKTSPLRVVKEANDLIIELSISHTLFDAGSDAVLRRDIARCYSGQPLNHDSKGALQAYYAHLEKTDTKSADKYWTNHLEGIEPTRLPPLGSTDDSFGYVDSTLDHELTLAIRPWCQRMKASPAAAIHVAWAIALSTYTESEDVCFGWLTAGRDAPITGIDDAIGMFVKLLVARIKVDQSQGIGDIVATAAQGIASGLQHQAGNLTLYRHGQNLFDTLVSVQTEFEEQSTSLETSSSLKFDAHPSIDRTTFSLVLHASIAPESTEFRMTFNTSKISESMAHAFFDAFHQALNAVLTSSAGTPVSSIDLCVPSHQKLMCAFNPDPIFDTPSGSSLTITDFFLAQVHQRPHAVAIRGWDYEFSYSQVNLLSISFARHLQHLGICHGDAVPLLCDKSAMVPVVVLGILRLGGVCIFLSPTDGIHRLQSIVATASHGPTRVVVASLRHASKAHTLGCTTVVELEKESLREDSSSQVIEDQSHPNDVAFLVFTSGSTGVPKGIRIHHEALCLSITSASSRLLVTKDSRILQFSAYTFDVSIGDMLFAFFNGGVLCVPSEDERLNDLNGAMQKFHANWSAMTPSVAILLQPEACQSLQTLVLIGEMALSEIYATWSPRINLFNAWGPAECSVVSSAYKVRSATDYEGRIGTPLSCRLWLVNPQDPSRHVPVGCVGELLVEGPHVALGYMRDKRKTEEVFISPSKTPSWLTPSPKSKFYLTGDLARFTPDEGITFLGRKDSQIKMHGQRIELGEIEFHVRRKVAELTWMPFAAAVDLFRHPTGGDTLVAFLARRNGDSAKNGRVQAVRPERLGLTEAGGWENMLKRSLCVNLPVYMVPSEFILVDALPKSPSGKLDRKELRLFAAEWMKRRSTQIDSKSYELNPMESSSQKSLADRIRALWARVMKLDEASIALEDHFFRRGGDSILAMRLSAAALDDGLHLPTVAIIKNPVLSSMVDAVRMDSPRDSLMNRNPPVPLEPSSSASRNDTIGDHASEFPATDFQSSMILSNIAPGRGFLNYFVLRLQPSTTNSMLENAWNQVLFRHSILRACCIRKQQQILYKISQSASEEQIQVHTIEEDDDADQYTRVLINVDRAGPLRFGDCLAKLFLVGSSSKDCSRAIIRLSHAQYDGMCIQALWNDLSLACSGAQLKPAANSFAEFAHSVTGLNEAARSYWHSYLLGSQITPLSDTADSFGNMDGHIQSSFSAKLFSLRDMTPATALKGAWALVLSWYSGSRDVLFGHLVSCRETLPSGMHEAVGAFINCIPVRARLEADMHPQCLLKHIHQHHIDSLEHNWIGLQTLIKSCTEWPSTARFSSVVQYQNMLASLSSLQRIDTCGLNGTTIDVVARSGAYSDVWITATPSEDGKSVVVDCHFDKIVLDKCVAAKLLVGLKAALQFLHTDQPVLRFRYE
ncbi:hypothetical protein CFE70_009451 [Pyrenophora teres f. teres 0-1]